MYIGSLHSFKQKDLWNEFPAILIRFGFDEWKYGHINKTDWKKYIYGQHSKRAKLRELIYPNLTYYDWFNLMQYYPLVFLSINFDIYPSQDEFIAFTKDIVKTFKKKYPNKDFILGAGNETQEKRQSAEKVMETAIDVYCGALNAGILEPKICIYNQKIKTQEEQKCIKKILDDDFIQHYVDYFGYQSLDTTPAKLKEYIPLIKQKGFEPVDVELGTKTSDLKTIKELFDIGVKKVFILFILAPEISEELANHDKNFKDYSLRIKDYKKDKFKIIQYAMQYKTKEEFIIGDDDMKLEKYYYKGRLDSLIKYDKQGYGIRFLRACFGLNDSNVFDVVLTTEVEEYQSANGLLIDGKVGPETFGNMIKVADYFKYYCWVHSLWARDM